VRARLVSLLLWALPAGAAECPTLEDPELRQLVALELGERAPRLEVRCAGTRAELRLDEATRSVELSATPPGARARLIALSAAALEPIVPPARTQRRNKSEAAMWKQLLAVTLVVAPAAAAPSAPRSEARVEAHPTALTRPPPRPRAAEAPAPQLRVEDLFSRVGEKVQAVNEAQRKLLHQLLAHTTDGDAEKADLLLRLADLSVEDERYHRFRARSLDQRLFEAKNAERSSEASQLKATQAEEDKRAQAALHEAVKRYLEIANGPYQSWAKMDEVLFDLGRLLGEAGRAEAAREFWRRLVKDYPSSKYVPDGLLAFGDEAFAARDLQHASAFYEKVIASGDATLGEYARYKLGWVDYNLGDFKSALEAFVAVLDHAQKGERGAARLQLGREAQKDTVRAYARIGATDRAWPFFQRVGGAAAPAMLEQLAELDAGDGRFVDAVRLYRQLMALAPASPRLCAWQAEVVRATLGASGSRAEAETVRELGRLTELEARSADAECRSTTAGLLRELATVWHQEAQRTRETATYQRAGELYRLYLKAFAGAPDAVTMTFYYAELLNKLARACEAAPLYVEVVKQDPERREDAALAAVLEWRSCLKLDLETRMVPRRGAAREIPEAWKKMIEAFDFYLKYVDHGPERVRVKYQKGLAYYELDRCDEAIPVFSDVARHHQDSELAPYAADLLFDCRAQEAKRTVDKAALRADVFELCAVPALTGPRPDFAKRCRVIEVALGRDEAETLEAAREYKRAAQLYERLAVENPDDPKRDEILYDSGVDYQRAQLVGPSILMMQELARTRPDSPLAKKALFSVGRSFQNIAAFDAAADNYEKFAARWPEDRDAPQALYRASFLRMGLGDSARAVEDTRQFLQRYSGRADLAETNAAVAFGEGQIYEQARDWPKLQQHLEKYLREWGERGGADRQVIAHVKLGEIWWRASCPVEGATGACVERLRESRKDSCGGKLRIVAHPRRTDLVAKAEAQFAAALKLQRAAKRPADAERAAEMDWYAAEARMLQADAGFERFLALQLPASPKKLGAWFAEKTQKLERARKDYESVILMKQAHWAIAAAGRVGQMFSVFAAQIDSSPLPPAPAPPRGVDAKSWREDFKSAYCDQLGAHVVTLEDKAEDALKMCLEKSTSLSWFNEWSALCEAELHQMRPRTYPLAAELRAEPRFVSATVERAGPQK
jgi:tetratricopeptide (TPR) repeat protein